MKVLHNLVLKRRIWDPPENHIRKRILDGRKTENPNGSESCALGMRVKKKKKSSFSIVKR